MNATTPIEIIASQSMRDLATRVYNRLAPVMACSYTQLKETTFANGEYKPHIMDTIRQKDVYYFHDMHFPDASAGLVRLALTGDALSRASIKSLTYVLPDMTYSRQDRKDEPRVPISAKAVANILQLSPKLERIITMDLHCDQLQGFYEIPVDNLYASVVYTPYIKQKLRDSGKSVADLVVISPDFGGMTRARRTAQSFGADVPVYSFDKRRTGPNKVEEIKYIGGDLTGKTALLVDDILDTGDSALKAAKALYERGATGVIISAAHGVLSAKDGISAESKFAAAGIPVVITESIPKSEAYLQDNRSWLKVLPLDELLANAIRESSTVGGSVSKLFPPKAA